MDSHSHRSSLARTPLLRTTCAHRAPSQYNETRHSNAPTCRQEPNPSETIPPTASPDPLSPAARPRDREHSTARRRHPCAPAGRRERSAQALLACHPKCVRRRSNTVRRIGSHPCASSVTRAPALRAGRGPVALRPLARQYNQARQSACPACPSRPVPSEDARRCSRTTFPDC